LTSIEDAPDGLLALLRLRTVIVGGAFSSLVLGPPQLAAPFFADRHGASINTNPACGFHSRVYQLC